MNTHKALLDCSGKDRFTALGVKSLDGVVTHDLCIQSNRSGVLDPSNQFWKRNKVCWSHEYERCPIIELH